MANTAERIAAVMKYYRKGEDIARILKTVKRMREDFDKIDIRNLDSAVAVLARKDPKYEPLLNFINRFERLDMRVDDVLD